METKAYCVEINGFSNTFGTLREFDLYVQGLKKDRYVKSGDTGRIHFGTLYKSSKTSGGCYHYPTNSSKTFTVN